MDTNILQEYLIQVGVRSDTGALSKFNSIISAIEKTAVGLTAALAAGALAIEGFVYVTTNEMDDLYWATKRMKSSASDIQDFQLRMQKAGSTTAEAQADLEALAAFRRSNFAGDSFLRLIGVDPSSDNNVKIMDSLINRFKQLNAMGQYPIAVRYGEQLGLSERQVWNMLQTSEKAENIYADMYRRLGINQKEATQNAHDYQNKLKVLDSELKVISFTLGLKFLPVADEFLKWLTSPAAEQMGKSLLVVASAIGNIATNAAKVLASLPPEAQELGLIGLLLFGKKAAAVMAAIGIANSLQEKIFGKPTPPAVIDKKEKEAGESRSWWAATARFLNDTVVLKRLNDPDFNATYDDYKKKKAAAEAAGKPLNLKNQDQYNEGFGVGAGQPGDKGFSPDGQKKLTTPKRESLSDWLGSLNKSGTLTAPFGKKKEPPLGVRSNNPGNLQPGGKETVYKTPEEGLKDMGRLLLSYSRQGLTSIKDIVSKFAPEFDKNGKHINNTQAYINRVAKEMGVAATAGLNLNNPDTLKRLMASMIRFEQGYAPYSDKLIGDAANAAAQAGKAAATGASPKATANATSSPASAPQIGFQSAPLGAVPASKSVTVHQTNNTTIHGAKDPAETATKVSRVMDRAQGDLVRNFSPALI